MSFWSQLKVRSITILVVEVGVVDGVLEEVLVAAVEQEVMWKPQPLEILASSLPWGPSELCSSLMPAAVLFSCCLSHPLVLWKNFFIRIMDHVCLEWKLKMYPCSSSNILMCSTILWLWNMYLHRLFSIFWTCFLHGKISDNVHCARCRGSVQSPANGLLTFIT